MPDNDTLMKVRQIILEASDLAGIDDDEELFQSGVIDSLGLVRLLIALEEELGVYVAITEFDRESMSTAAKIAGVVDSRLAK